MSTAKYWRISEEEYNLKEKMFVRDRVEYISKNIDEIFKCPSTKKKVKKNIEEYNILLRFSFSNMTEDIINFAVLNIIGKDVSNWASFSSNIYEDPNEIIFRTIMSKKRGAHIVSLNMEESNPNITHDMWKDISYIVSGLFNFEEWDDNHVDAIYSTIYKSKTDKSYRLKKDEELLMYYRPEQIPRKLINYIDWPHITDPSLSDIEVDNINNYNPDIYEDHDMLVI